MSLSRSFFRGLLLAEAVAFPLLKILASLAEQAIGGAPARLNKSLGLSPSIGTKFVPVVQDYITSKEGAGVSTLFAGALK